MLFRDKLQYQFNSLEKELVNLSAEIVKSVQPSICSNNNKLRLLAESSFEQLLTIDSDEGEGHLRLLRIKDLLRFEQQNYLKKLFVLNDCKLIFDPEFITDCKLYAKILIESLGHDRSSLVLQRIQPEVFSGTGGWGDSAEIMISQCPEGFIKIEFSENNSNCCYRGSHFEALMHKLRINFEIEPGSKTQIKGIDFNYRIHDYGNHQFGCSRQFRSESQAASFISEILQAIKDTPRDALLLANAANFKFANILGATDMPSIDASQKIFCDSLEVDLIFAEDNRILVKMLVSERHLARLYLDGKVKPADFKRNYFSPESVTKIIEWLEANSVSEVLFNAVNYSDLVGKSSYAGSKEQDSAIIQAFIRKKPQFSISVMNSSSPKDEIVTLWNMN